MKKAIIFDWYNYLLNAKDVEVVWIEGEEAYNFNEKAVEKIGMIKSRLIEFDLIVIGNNMGGGLYKADLIPNDIKDKVVIVWNDDSIQNRQSYMEKGFIHFSSRSGLCDYVKNM